jgi:hypothetical protein
VAHKPGWAEYRDVPLSYAWSWSVG